MSIPVVSATTLADYLRRPSPMKARTRHDFDIRGRHEATSQTAQ